MARKLVKKRRLKIIPFLILILFVSIFSFLVKTYIDEPIKNIVILNNNYITDVEVIRISKLENYPSFIKINTKKIKNDLLKQDIIKDVEIKRKFYNKLEITIKEHDILFKLASNEKYVFSNQLEKNLNYDIIVPTLVNYVPDEKYEDLIKKLSKIKKSVRVKISEIIYEPTELDEDRFLIIMTDNNLVYLTLTKFNKIDYYNDVLPELENHKGIFHFDSGNHFEIIK